MYIEKSHFHISLPRTPSYHLSLPLFSVTYWKTFFFHSFQNLEPRHVLSFILHVYHLFHKHLRFQLIIYILCTCTFTWTFIFSVGTSNFTRHFQHAPICTISCYFLCQSLISCLLIFHLSSRYSLLCFIRFMSFYTLNTHLHSSNPWYFPFISSCITNML